MKIYLQFGKIVYALYIGISPVFDNKKQTNQKANRDNVLNFYCKRDPEIFFPRMSSTHHKLLPVPGWWACGRAPSTGKAL